MSAVKVDRAWLWFAAWLLLGAGWCLALLTALTIGVFVAPVVLAATALLLWRAGKRSAVGLPGLVSGPALLLFFVGYLNRGGPGDVCTADGTTCTEEWDPTGWLVAGSVLLLAGVALFLVLRLVLRRRDRRVGTRRSPAGGPAGLRFTA
ncbi:hypothetical protein ACEZDB_03025 [Streptacidiphilus sp. N1-3]|uniref:Integral membrane protein n=1 Tax=Streptacidiphilus alkalitolerans TaxID=3342712 RepID=A0ABV6WUK0_9ACTN